MARPFVFCVAFVCFITVAAQQASLRTDMPVPPLQWINITGLTTGSPPQPLMDSSIGYDESTRSLIIFGGESQAGIPQQNTYLLDMDSLTWSTPLSNVPKLSSSPPPRSRALGTGDFAANSRRDFLVYGGKGASNQALGDVWAYNFLNQFWFNIALSGSAPSPRWGSVGGIDPAQIPTSGNNVSTVFNIAGGSDDTTVFPSSDLWQLSVTGTLASDVFSIEGLWSDTSLSTNLPGKVEAGGALVSQSQATGTRIAISGGCGFNANPLNANVSCVDPSTYIVTVTPGSSIQLGQCPVPRLGPALVPNLNAALSSFASQSFMLLGTFDSSQWNDSGGLAQGEVAVLDVGAGTWARVLPAGDPAPGKPVFPTPREGAAALAFPSALVGENRPFSSDTVVFGGRDAQGNYMNDIWILRAYNGSITQSGEHWTGFGNGVLETGVSASGTGVSVQYLSQCAQPLKPTPTSSSGKSSSTRQTQTQTQTQTATSQTGLPLASTFPAFEVSTAHRLLSPLSIALVLAATILVRLFSPVFNSASKERHLAFAYVAVPAGLVAYAVGVAGFTISLTSTTRVPSALQRRTGTSSNTFLRTPHGRAGFALFVGLYGFVPILALVLWVFRWIKHTPREIQVEDDTHGQTFPETGPISNEKDSNSPSVMRAASPAQSAPEVHSTASSVRDRRQRAQSGPGLFPKWTRDREPSEKSEPSSSKGFEVVNRPRRASGGTPLYPLRDVAQRPRADVVRSLNDISWLERRRSVSAVGELDYALSHGSPRSASPPVTSRPPTVTMSNRPFVRTPTPQPMPPSLELGGWDILLHTLFHAFLLANSILVLIALFSRAPLAAFVVFLIWILAFYACLLLLAWNGRPRASMLVFVLTRFRPPVHNVLPTSDDHGSQLSHTPMPGGSPYVYHQPAWRRAVSPEDDLAARTSHLGGPHTLETDDPGDEDDDENDDDRQRRMEEELERRDVHIVTVPRRRLWITNPS
ncbi:hypothetical protein K439DRAFT_1504033 [Ramaria rubella]|nr:hypothetical protein K439DRAFT_1504033 [Ramaria rubella]